MKKYKIDSIHSSGIWTVQHLGIPTAGLITGIQGEIEVEDHDVATFSGVIPANGLISSFQALTQHMMGADMFDAANYPNIEFKGKTTGGVEIKIKKFIRYFPIKVSRKMMGGENPMSKKSTVGATVDFDIPRLDFDIASGIHSSMVGNNVQIKLFIAADEV